MSEPTPSNAAPIPTDSGRARLNRRHFIGALGIAALASALYEAGAADKRFPAEMTGTFSGSAKIVVNWTKQRNLPVKLTINADRSVSGKIGDAVLKNGRLKKNRGAIGRKLNIKTDHIITGDLSGPIIAAEKITREGVSVPLNFKQGTYTGGLHTSGGKTGGREKMKLSASNLKLTGSEK